MKIGITAASSKTQYFLNQAYVDYVSKAGHQPIIISPVNDLKIMADVCDGLLIPGGRDIEPTFYGENNVASNNVDPVRDEFERKTMHTFINKKKPIMGICRGFQLMVREFMYLHDDNMKGIEYWQHLGGHNITDLRDIPRNVASHGVIANYDKLYGDEGEKEAFLFVNSIHHQAVVAKNKDAFIQMIDPENSMFVTAHTDFGMGSHSSHKDKSKNYDYVVEGADMRINGCHLRGVQWHPEELVDTALFNNFFESFDTNEEENKISSIGA